MLDGASARVERILHRPVVTSHDIGAADPGAVDGDHPHASARGGSLVDREVEPRPRPAVEKERRRAFRAPVLAKRKPPTTGEPELTLTTLRTVMTANRHRGAADLAFQWPSAGRTLAEAGSPWPSRLALSAGRLSVA